MRGGYNPSPSGGKRRDVAQQRVADGEVAYAPHRPCALRATGRFPPQAGEDQALATAVVFDPNRSIRWSPTRMALATVVRVGFTAAEVTKNEVSTT